MVREDLVSSAITFLQDPSVAASPLDKRTAFLQSKNLTQEEIDTALARAGEDAAGFKPNTVSTASPPNYGYSGQQVSRAPPQGGYGYGYGPYQGGPWGQPPPPELPRRDWRDWFIMATVTSGVGYGLYVVAKRYVMPLISPPTPPQLEQDKADIEASFIRAFELIEQLGTDTAILKTTEEERTEKLDTALHEVEAVISELKIASKRREEEGRRIGDEVRALKDMIPKALEGWKSDGDGRLKELGGELKSLKMLIGNRVGGSAAQTPLGRAYGANGGGSNTPRQSAVPNPPYSGNSVGEREDDVGPQNSSSTPSAPAPGVNVPKRDSSNSYGFEGKPSSRAAIPAWQMAATGNKSKGDAPSSSVNGEGSKPANETSADA